MIDTLKGIARRRFPIALNALHSFRLSKQLEARKSKLTPYGFHFRGHEEMENGTFEPLESKLISDFARRGTVLVDIGANLGYFACVARGQGSHVVAVEPFSQNLEVLYDNLQANGWSDVEVFPVGVGADPGLALLYGGGTAASMLRNWAGTSEVWKRTIALSTIDIILGDRFAAWPMLVKIDIEGFEHVALEGATRTLDRGLAPRWLVEVCLTENHPDGYNPHFADVFRKFWQHGYTARSVEGELREVTPADVEKWVTARRRDFGYVTYLFERT